MPGKQDKCRSCHFFLCDHTCAKQNVKVKPGDTCYRYRHWREGLTLPW